MQLFAMVLFSFGGFSVDLRQLRETRIIQRSYQPQDTSTRWSVPTKRLLATTGKLHHAAAHRLAGFVVAVDLVHQRAEAVVRLRLSKPSSRVSGQIFQNFLAYGGSLN